MILERRNVLTLTRDWPPERVLATTLWGEIRGGSTEQIMNVALCIRNRVRAYLGSSAAQPDWWGEGYTGVCLARAQFSCWWDAQQEHMLALQETDPTYRRMLVIARSVMAWNKPDEPTRGATNYHAHEVLPPWAITLLEYKTLDDGKHIFYRDPAAKYPEDVVRAAVQQTTPTNIVGPATAAGASGAGAIVTGLSSISPEQATGWLGFARSAVVFANQHWFLLTMALFGLSFAMGIAWWYRRRMSQRVAKL